MRPSLGALKALLNRLLAPANVRVESLTGERNDSRRFKELEQNGHFDRPIYAEFRPSLILESAELLARIETQKAVHSKFASPELNDVGYSFDNAYFSSPDTEVLYALIEMNRPKRIVEVGSGNSTKVMRQAILDWGLDTRIVSVDPHPRVDVGKYADEVHSSRVEELDPQQVAGSLESGDILFIDSSHLIETGGDVSFLYFHVLPKLKAGVLIHVHDIFLPYEYPKEWLVDLRWKFNEQSLLIAILTWSDAFAILWAGHSLQRSNPDFNSWFPHVGTRRAQSFWLRKK